MQRKQLLKEHGRWKLMLSPKERGELCRFRNRHPLPYLRERVAALLKIADGKSPHWVARHGWLKPRDPDIVYKWLRRYMRAGVAEHARTQRVQRLGVYLRRWRHWTKAGVVAIPRASLVTPHGVSCWVGRSFGPPI